jgi:ABC-type multidrug transport system fused ATPase/permease subunit
MTRIVSCGVLLIRCYRLNTIMDSDRIVVMDQGRVAEYDSPSALLAQPESMFKSLADNWDKAAGNV